MSPIKKGNEKYISPPIFCHVIYGTVVLAGRCTERGTLVCIKSCAFINNHGISMCGPLSDPCFRKYSPNMEMYREIRMRTHKPQSRYRVRHRMNYNRILYFPLSQKLYNKFRMYSLLPTLTFFE